MSTLKELRREWDEVTLLKMFEIPVIDKRTGEHEYILFNIDFDNICFIASHEALSTEQENSNKIAFVDWLIDVDFSLDENLQTLHELCMNAIIDSEFFNLE